MPYIKKLYLTEGHYLDTLYALDQQFGLRLGILSCHWSLPCHLLRLVCQGLSSTCSLQSVYVDQRSVLPSSHSHLICPVKWDSDWNLILSMVLMALTSDSKVIHSHMEQGCARIRPDWAWLSCASSIHEVMLLRIVEGQPEHGTAHTRWSTNNAPKLLFQICTLPFSGRSAQIWRSFSFHDYVTCRNPHSGIHIAWMFLNIVCLKWTPDPRIILGICWCLFISCVPLVKKYQWYIRLRLAQCCSPTHLSSSIWWEWGKVGNFGGKQLTIFCLSLGNPYLCLRLRYSEASGLRVAVYNMNMICHYLPHSATTIGTIPITLKAFHYKRYL